MEQELLEKISKEIQDEIDKEIITLLMFGKEVSSNNIEEFEEIK